MQYLVEMRLADSGRSTSPQEGLSFIEQYVLPTLELRKKLEEEKKILAGGPMSGTIGIALILKAESAQELDELIGGMPVWPLMETSVTPLTTFDGRIATLSPRLARLKASLKK